MATKKLRTIDPKEDYLLFNLIMQAYRSIGICCDYMQANTKYGEAYKIAYDKYKKARRALESFEDALVETIYNKKEG